MKAPQISQLSVASAFDALDPKQKLYAHYMAKAAWAGSRIVFRQVSPEANDIFDFVIALYDGCDGDWERLATVAGVEFHDVQLLLDYAATFLSNMGNYYGSGDQKFTPAISAEKLAALADSASPRAAALWGHIRDAILQETPLSLGPPSDLTQSAYYPGFEGPSFQEDMAHISKTIDELAILPENTRVEKKRISPDIEVFNILQASVAEKTSTCHVTSDPTSDGRIIRLVNGDHKEEMTRISAYLSKALQYTSNRSQDHMVQKLLESFITGNLETYKDAQRLWVNDKAPPVETVLGFVEPYRDPLGVRSEFEGIVGIPDANETKILGELSRMADKFVCRLPWVTSDSDDKGPFEKEKFEAPDFSSVQSLAYCSSIIFPGINLPNYNDIRQETGYKGIIFSNRMVAESRRPRGLHLVDKSEQDTFKKHRFHAYYIWVVLHEILGHGTGKFLNESTPGSYNFDPDNPPLNPITGKPVSTWYGPGQTWTGVFGDLSTTVDECRAELVGAYLIDDQDISALFGYSQQGEVTPDDVVYNLYLQLGTDGLRGLENYDPTTKKWGQAHSRAHYAMLRHLLRDTQGLYTVICDPQAGELTVKVDRNLIIQQGKPSLGRMLLRLHMYRCTADIAGCRTFYEDLTAVDDEALKWREIVIAKKDPPLIFSHANTYLDGDTVNLREYEPTSKGIIQSWAERGIDAVVA
ncbi:dipeptidyl peptidase III [Aspergillus campestris IBT 28561]|uniref:Dipeptidyl peptidase 3 n=1 Tax=Aspergillus campestris (strain IBT 28561) TaxID=1392248 RepID=A0A2I1D9T2_ASPC2|nr:dipeptidyl peptidase III [Aspergillus campestris IBT 28561]PKY06621.1 dipeptidyl peptidase III [Aspergillus campestris IBT 28561]